MNKTVLAALGACALAAPAAARPFTAADMVMLSRVSAPAISGDGHWLVWQQQETDLAANKGRLDLWRLDLTRRGAVPERLAAEADVNESAPQFARDGRHVFFKSDKGGEEAVWEIGVDGAGARRLTGFQGGFSGFKVAPTGDRILIWAVRKGGAASLAAVMPKEGPDQPRVYEKMFARTWDRWVDESRSQLFVLPLGPDGAPGDGIAIEHGLDGDAPSRPFGGGEELSWSADGRTVYFSFLAPGTNEALSNNIDLWSASADGSAAPTDLTAANSAMDLWPVVSPDGRYLAYAATSRPNVIQDRAVLMVRDLATGQTRALTGNWDHSILSIAWSPDGDRLIVTAEDTHDTPAWSVDVTSGKLKRLTGAGSVAAVAPTGRGIVYALDTLTAPDDFWRTEGGTTQRLTSVNADKLAGIDMPAVDWFTFNGAKNDKVWGYAMRPPNATGKVPFLLSVHGGPYGSNNDKWTYRPNAAVIAGGGYGVVSIDYHGSTGHGQAFADSIGGDWGGLPLDDFKAGLEAATDRFGWLDADRGCALGHSAGGYLINWIEGQWPDRFRCLIQSHGIFDLRSSSYGVDLQYFIQAQFGGKPYWQNPAAYERWNPADYVQRWKTPMLIFAGDRDFRVPETEAIETFDALQLRGVPSRLVVSPSDGHFITKPKNLENWNDEVLTWLHRWLKK